MGKYADLWAQEQQPNSITQRVANGKQLLSKWGSYIDKYHGGIHRGFLASIMNWESWGDFGAAGDASLGEVGFYQVAADVPKRYGLDPAIRTTPEGNVFVACLEYTEEAARILIDYPGLVNNGSRDQWILARLVFAIGRGGTHQVLNAAKPRAGHAYDDLVKWANDTGAFQVSASQPAEKVWFRILAVGHNWRIGELISPGASYGPPIKIPALSPYHFPLDVAPLIGSGSPATMLLMGLGLAGLAWALWK